LIYFIKGKLFDIKPDTLIIDNTGVGYEIFCTTKDISLASSKKGDEVFLYTYLVHREDAMILYGFLQEKTKKGFLELLKVDGIGPKLALKILSFYEVDILFNYIEKEDIDSLKKISGVGLKVASKIIFDLKGKIPTLSDEKPTGIEEDLINAMVGLGYQEQDVREKLKKLKPLDDTFEVEFKKLLKILSGK